MGREGNGSFSGSRTDPDYVLIGHISLDRLGTSEQLGGTVVYAGVTALRLGRHEVDSTGAGDVFAAAFFVRLDETGDPRASAGFASCAAGVSIEGVGVARIPDRGAVEARLHAVG